MHHWHKGKYRIQFKYPMVVNPLTFGMQARVFKDGKWVRMDVPHYDDVFRAASEEIPYSHLEFDSEEEAMIYKLKYPEMF